MSTVANDSSGASLHAAIFHYFRWLSSSSAAKTASTVAASSSLGSDEKDENDDKDEENTGRDPPAPSNCKGGKVLAALIEEFPEEFENFASAAAPIAPAPWLPDLKVRFDAYPFHMSRLKFLENRMALLEQRQNYSSTRAPPAAATANATSSKRKDPPLAAATNAAGIKRKDHPSTSFTSNSKKKQKPSKASPAKSAAVAVSANPVGAAASEPPQNQKQPASQSSAAGAASVISKSELKKEAASRNWEERYQQLVHFQKGYGHCRVPGRYMAIPGLGRWVAEQRAIYKIDPTLEPEWVQKLNAIGFDWVVVPPSKSWDERFDDLKEFQQEHGHTRVVRAYKPDPSLGEWVHTQRSHYRKKTPALMETDRLSKLQAIGFEFIRDRGHKSWEERFEQLVEFRRTHGHINVPLPEITTPWRRMGDKDNEDREYVMKDEQEDEFRFADWVRKQKFLYWKYKSGDRHDLTRLRFKKLDDIGCGREDAPKRLPSGAQRGAKHPLRNNDTWSLRIEQLRLYKERYGDCDVPGVWPENKQLGEWVKTQRKAYRKLQAGAVSHLTAGRRAELESLGFQWVLRPGQLKENRKKNEENGEIEREETLGNGGNLNM